MIPATWREAERVCGECATRCKLVGAGTARGRGLCRGRGAPVCERCPRGHDRPAGPPTVKLHVVRNYKSFIPDRRPAKQNFMFVEPNIRATSHLWIHTRYYSGPQKARSLHAGTRRGERERAVVLLPRCTPFLCVCDRAAQWRPSRRACGAPRSRIRWRPMTPRRLEGDQPPRRRPRPQPTDAARPAAGGLTRYVTGGVRDGSDGGARRGAPPGSLWVGTIDAFRWGAN